MLGETVDPDRNWERKYRELSGDTTLKDKVLAARLAGSLLQQARQFFPQARAIAEIGCGTGYFLDTIAGLVNESVRLEGVDLSPSAIEAAREKRSHRIQFFCENVLDYLERNPAGLDLILSQRVLQNILEEQDRAIELIHAALKPGGVLVMVEGAIEGMDALNAERAKLGLEPIEVVWHNKFIKIDEVTRRFADHFDWIVSECCSSYMLLTRVLYPFFEKNLAYGQAIHQYADTLPEMGNFGYFKLFTAKRKEV